MLVHDNPRFLTPALQSGEFLKAVAERAIRFAGIQENADQGKFYILDSCTIELLAVSIYEWLAVTGNLQDRENSLQRWRRTPGWIAVTSSKKGTWAEQERQLEACLTAIQRVTLALWRDEVSCEWLPLSECNEKQFIELIGADPFTERPVGVILYGETNMVNGIR